MNKSFELKDDASGASDTWAMMVAGVKYSYTLELGPLEKEIGYEDFGFGFHVNPKKIEYIVKRAFAGIYEYMRLFIEKMKQNAQREIEQKCLEEYNDLLDTFSGYWSQSEQT